MAQVRTAAQAAKWIDRAGIALLFPKADIVLPSLWEAVNGDRSTQWAVRDADGAFLGWTEEMGIVWGLKDELAERRLACVGKHLAGRRHLHRSAHAAGALRAHRAPGAARGLSRRRSKASSCDLCEAVLDARPADGPRPARRRSAPPRRTSTAPCCACSARSC